MQALYFTHPDEKTGLVAVITDEPCPCGWPESILHIGDDGATKIGCASCEVEYDLCNDSGSRSGFDHHCLRRPGHADPHEAFSAGGMTFRWPVHTDRTRDA